MSYIALTAKYCDLLKVRRRLRRKGLTAYVPAIVKKRTVIKAGKPVHKRKIMPLMHYVIIEAPSHPSVMDLWLRDVLDTKGVQGFVKMADKPAVITLGAMVSLKIEVSKLRFQIEAARQRGKISMGMRATVAGTGKTGTVQWMRGKSAGIEMMLFGSMRVVTVEKSKLEAA